MDAIPPAHGLRPDVRADARTVPWAAALVATALCFCYTLPFLGWLPLTGGMEANVVIAAREAVRDGHWFPGTQNGAPRLRKPPLAHWTTAVGIMTARQWPSATAARWPTLLMASVTVGAVVVLGALVLGREGGLASGVVAATVMLFVTYARKASYDTQVTLWTTLADVGLAYALFRGRKWGLVVAGVALVILLPTVMLATAQIWEVVSRRA